MFHSSSYTVESVTSGHPDKVCDQISDAILDAYLTQDPQSRVAVECFGGHGLLVIGGEVTSRGAVDAEAVARQVYRDIGYTDELRVITNIVKQSPDIAQGVDTGGAGDQGIMYGYATNETSEFLPRALVLAHNLSSGLERLRRSGELSWLGPDGKTQVTIHDGKLETILVSTQHMAEVSQQEIREKLIEKLIRPLIKVSGRSFASLEDDDLKILINPTGKFEQGGFFADTGLTGRKIMVDTYGGLAPHGGGAFSGKDATKVDRSAAYMARFVAKNVVANGLADRCLVSVAYAIGRAEPVMVKVVDGKGREVSPDVLSRFDFRPNAIIERLNLRSPIFKQTAAYGHFGKAGLPWEQVVSI
ncbi:methionine adenosyltransferase [Candidatus Uhrbacteria bacterium]|nr:methionine adenosyltransferase [Candidatus Uhrbacteria bacterium]